MSGGEQRIGLRHSIDRPTLPRVKIWSWFLGEQRSNWQVLLPILLLAALVRLPGLLSRSLWYDEAFAVLFSSKGPGSMVYGTLSVEEGVAADVHPLLFYTLLWAWGRIFGTSLLAMRSLPLIFGLGVVGVGFGLAQRLFDRRTAVLAGCTLALAPFQIHYAQEVRMYGLLALVLVGGTWVYWEALQRGGFWKWVLFGILAAAAQYTQQLAAFYLVALGLTPIWMKRWKAFLSTIGAGALALALYAPWGWSIANQIARIERSYWIQKPSLVEILQTLMVYVSELPVPAWALPIVMFSALLLPFVAMWVSLRVFRVDASGGLPAIWLATLALVPMGLMYAISQFIPVYLPRALLPSGAVYLIWLAWALGYGRQSGPLLPTGWLALSAAFFLGLVGFYSYGGFPYAPFDELNRYLSQEMDASEAIVHSNKISAIPAAYDNPALDHPYLADPPGSSSDTLAPATQEVLGLMASATIEEAVGEAEGIWFVIFPREIEDYRRQGVETHPGITWLEDRCSLDQTLSFGELSVYHFVDCASGP